MSFEIERRDLITLLAGAAALWPLAARSELAPGKVPRIGFLQFNNPHSENEAAFIQGLREAGYIDGRNAIIETRYYEPRRGELARLASELVALKCDVIFAAAPYAIEAAMNATTTIPIVGVDLESDPVASGWIKSLAYPGRNLSGLFLDIPQLAGKQIEFLKEAVPALSHLAILWDSTIGIVQFRATEAAARAAGIMLQSLSVQRSEDFTTAFDRAIRERVHGMVVLSSPLINTHRSQIVEWALEHRLPTVSLFTQFPRSGGLIAYGPNLADLYRGAATYVDRILKGGKVSELPIQRPTRFDLIINLKTAKTIGLNIAPMLLARADEVIE